MATPDDDPSRSFRAPTKTGRRYSIWTLLAPAAVLILWIGVATSVGNSCVVHGGCTKKSDDSAGDATDKRNELLAGARKKVKPGDTLGKIAASFDLTEAELKACNPKVDPQNLQPNTYLFVSAVDCEEADLAETGANPDPLAGDTAASADAAAAAQENGTAAADPSAQADAPKSTTTTTDGTDG